MAKTYIRKLEIVKSYQLNRIQTKLYDLYEGVSSWPLLFMTRVVERIAAINFEDIRYHPSSFLFIYVARMSKDLNLNCLKIPKIRIRDLLINSEDLTTELSKQDSLYKFVRKVTAKALWVTLELEVEAWHLGKESCLMQNLWTLFKVKLHKFSQL